MSKHTPGPWKLVRDGQEPSDGWLLVQFREWSVYSEPMHGDSIGTQESDARLIAAAPEMLAALKAVLPVMRRRHLAYSLVIAVEEAIAKAEGGEQ